MGFLGVIVLMVVLVIGATPTITVSAPDENDCQHVRITRFWEQSVMVDAVSCDGQPVIINGENVLETEQ